MPKQNFSGADHQHWLDKGYETAQTVSSLDNPFDKWRQVDDGILENVISASLAMPVYAFMDSQDWQLARSAFGRGWRKFVGEFLAKLGLSESFGTIRRYDWHGYSREKLERVWHHIPPGLKLYLLAPTHSVAPSAFTPEEILDRVDAYQVYWRQVQEGDGDHWPYDLSTDEQQETFRLALDGAALWRHGYRVRSGQVGIYPSAPEWGDNPRLATNNAGNEMRCVIGLFKVNESRPGARFADERLHQIITLQEAATEYSLPLNQLQALVEEGALPARFFGRGHLVTRDSIELLTEPRNDDA